MRNDEIVRNLYWWRARRRLPFLPAPINLGDALSPFIVRATLGELSPGKPSVPPIRPAMFAIGSVLNHAQNGDVIWGTGYNGVKPNSVYRFDSLDVRAVRGPLTRELLRSLGIDAPEVFGDPGILISRYIPVPATAESGPLVIPHFREDARAYRDHRTIRTVGTDFAGFARTVAASSIVVSSSLHGLVIAEAYGVPAVLLRTADSETIHKYDDYYRGTGRSSFPSATTVEEALSLIPASRPDLPLVQDRLVRAFPVDLWSPAMA